jgi:Fe2+ or Zn2+ uptake regulation protein
MATDPHETVAQRLHRTRQRYTEGRRELVDRLLGAGRPVTIAELMQGGAEQSQSSTYRNLAVLEACGVVLRLPSVDGLGRFELSEDLTHHHHHLVCVDCGRLDDVELSDAVEATLHRVTTEAGRSLGYEVAEHRLELLGRCGDCR